MIVLSSTSKPADSNWTGILSLICIVKLSYHQQRTNWLILFQLLITFDPLCVSASYKLMVLLINLIVQQFSRRGSKSAGSTSTLSVAYVNTSCTNDRCKWISVLVGFWCALVLIVFQFLISQSREFTSIYMDILYLQDVLYLPSIH